MPPGLGRIEQLRHLARCQVILSALVPVGHISGAIRATLYLSPFSRDRWHARNPSLIWHTGYHTLYEMRILSKSGRLSQIQIEPPRHVEVERAVRAHMPPNQRCETAPVRRRHTCHPGGLGEYTLKHQRVDVHKTRLEQVKRVHGDFLIFEPIARDFAALTKENEAIRTVPGLDDVQSFMAQNQH